MEAPGSEAGPGPQEAPNVAIEAVTNASILPYFLQEVRRQDGEASLAVEHPGETVRRVVSTPYFGGSDGQPSLPNKPRALQQKSTPPAVLTLSPLKALKEVLGESPKGEWLAASLDSACQSSEALSLLNHMRALASRLFAENALLKSQAQLEGKPYHQGARPRHRRTPREQLVSNDEARRVRDITEENSYLKSFINADARVLQNAKLARIQKELQAALEKNQTLQEQAQKDRAIIAELELRSRAFADAYAWLTSHNRMIHARDAPTLVALWRKRVAATGAAGQGTLMPEFAEDLSAAYIAADSEEDTEATSEDGNEEGSQYTRQLAAALREAETTSEVRQAQTRARLAERRAEEAERLLVETRAQLKKPEKAASKAAANPPAPCSAALSNHEVKLEAALKESQLRAAAAERECTKLAEQLSKAQKAVDAAVLARKRAEQEKAQAMAEAEARMSAERAQFASELANMKAQHQTEIGKLNTAAKEAAELRLKLRDAQQQCADLRAELDTAKLETGGAQISKVASSRNLVSPAASDISTLTSERDTYKATALRLEMDIKRLKARLDEAAQLEKTVFALKEKLSAGEELKKAYENLQREASTLRGKLSEVHATEPQKGPRQQDLAKQAMEELARDKAAMTEKYEFLKKKVGELEEQLEQQRSENQMLKAGREDAYKVSQPEATQPSSKAGTPTPDEVAALIKERDSLQEKILSLEKELSDFRTSSSRGPAKEPVVAKPSAGGARAEVAKKSPPSGAAKAVAKDTKVPAPPKKVIPTEAVISSSDSFSAEAREKLEKEVDALKEQLLAGKEVQTAYEALQKEVESLRGQLKDAQALGQPKGPPPTAPASSSAGKTAPPLPGDHLALVEERDNLLQKVKALEAELTALKAQSSTLASAKQVLESKALPPPQRARPSKAGATAKPAPLAKGTVQEPSATAGDQAAAQEQEKLKEEIRALREQVAAGEELKMAHESLKREMERMQAENSALKKNEEASKALPPKVPQPVSKAAMPTPDEVAALIKERDTWKDRVEGLEKELSDIRTSSRSHAKEAPAAKTSANGTHAEVLKKPPTPMPKPGGTAVESGKAIGAEAGVEVPPADSVATPLSKSKSPPPPPVTAKVVAKDTKVPAPPKKAPPVEAGAGTLDSSLEGEKAKVVAELEEELKALRPKAEAAAQLTQDIARLREQVAAGEVLKTAHEALEKEHELLKKQLCEMQDQSGSVSANGDRGKADSVPSANDLIAIQKERDDLKGQVARLETELAALRATSKAPEKAAPGSKEVSTAKSPGKVPPPASVKKTPLPPPKPGKAAADALGPKAVADEKGEQASPAPKLGRAASKTAIDTLPPKGSAGPAAAAKLAETAGASEASGTKPPLGGETLPPHKLGPPLGKKALPPKSGKAPLPAAVTSAAKEESASDEATAVCRAYSTAKQADKPSQDGTSGALSPSKPIAKDTKVPAPPKKASPVEAPSSGGGNFTLEAKTKLEKEIESLREKLADSEKLRVANGTLQKEVEALQGELNAIKTKAESGATEAASGASPAMVGEMDTLRKERNSLQERVAALEAELITLRAPRDETAAIPKTKARLPPKGKPAKEPLPSKVSQSPGEKERPDAKASEAPEPAATSPSAISAEGEAGGEQTGVGKAPREDTGAPVGPPDKANLLTEEVLSKSDAETDVGDSGAESHSEEERVATLKERLQRAKRRVRNLVVKCNALIEMEKERDSFRSRLESLQAKHDALRKAQMEARDKENASAAKSASDTVLPSSPSVSDTGSASLMETGMSAQSTSAQLDAASAAELTEKYDKLKVQRDKLYQSYKAQKERIAELEQQGIATQERLERAERLYHETQEELRIVTQPATQAEDAEPTGLLSWFGGGGTPTSKSPDEAKLRARLELMQQRLKNALADNESLSAKLAQLRTSPKGSPRETSGTAEAEGEPRQMPKGTAKHKSPEAGEKKVAQAKVPLKSKAPPATEGGAREGAETLAQLAELQKQIKEKDAQIEAHKAEIVRLGAATAAAGGEGALRSELAKREEELKTKTVQLEKATEEAKENEKLIQAKDEELKKLKAKLEALEKEKAQAISETNALKKQLEEVQKELELLKGGGSGATVPSAKSKDVGEASLPAKAVKRAPSLTKRAAGPPSPPQKSESPVAAPAAATSGQTPEVAKKKPKASTLKAQDATPKAPAEEEKSPTGAAPTERQGAAGEGFEADSLSAKKTTKAEDTEEEKKPKKSSKDKTGDTKKKKKKEVAFDEGAGPPSDKESVAPAEEDAKSTAVATSNVGWGFGLFDNSAPSAPPEDNEKEPPADSQAAARPSLLSLIVGPEPAAEPPKERDLPPLRLSAVEGADDQSDDSSSESEAEGGIAATVAGFFWGA
ncbi:hypothetical protein cyc_06043 [Cyclospora cayetanensis]|uniref:Uncharacterized protein n=1 Tax=Cyclospora cayetanensis TaxID=88456 RepID=A0A1D3D7D5_9EIME|nr:hypothetical protein cyc_06043 [Cyclospora cayetanensis]